jgi:hypothetical protein
MSYENSEIKRISDRYGQSDEDGREQLFEELFTLHYHMPHPVPDDHANTLKRSLLRRIRSLPKEANSDTMEVYIMQELYDGFQQFCMSNPSEIDYAWNAMVLFIAKLDEHKITKDEFDAHTFAVTELKWWIAENCSDDHCDMSGTTSNAVLDSDSSILALTRAEMEENEAQQLANLARNRKDRKQCIVNKVIAARALRDGYAPAPSGPGGTFSKDRSSYALLNLHYNATKSKKPKMAITLAAMSLRPRTSCELARRACWKSYPETVVCSPNATGYLISSLGVMANGKGLQVGKQRCKLWSLARGRTVTLL